MLKWKKPNVAHAGYEINNEFPIRQVRVTSGCRYYQVDMGSIFFGKGGRKNFASAKKARAFAAKSTTKAADGGIKVMALPDLKAQQNVEEEVKTAEAVSSDPQHEALEILNSLNVDLVEAARFYAAHHSESEQPESKKAKKSPRRNTPSGADAPGIYTPAEVRKIMTAASSELVPYFALGLFAGLRVREMLELNWRDVDFGKGELRINNGSSKAKKRIVQMEPNLAKFLTPFRGTPKASVIPQKAANLQRWASKLLSELEIKTIKQGARQTYITFHLALHTMDETMQELGYTDGAKLFKYYRGLTPNSPKQAEKYFAIEPVDQNETASMKKEAA